MRESLELQFYLFLSLKDLYDFRSDSDPDESQYEAKVCASLQKVSLVNTSSQQTTSITVTHSSSSPKVLVNFDADCKTQNLSHGLRTNEAMLNDSSPEESSYNPDDFDDDDDGLFSKNFCSNNGNCSFIDELKNSPLSSKFNARLLIPEYSAEEENRNVRNFQCVSLPDGKTREIDMKVLSRFFFIKKINILSFRLLIPTSEF